MKTLGTYTIGNNSLTVAEAQAAKEAADLELTEWRARRADVDTRLTAVKERCEGLAVQIANATLANADVKSFRRERGAQIAEAEELELAQRIAAEKITTLETAAARAERALRIALAFNQLDGLKTMAERVDREWAPMRDALAELILAHQDVARLLDGLIPGSHHERDKTALMWPLLWPLRDYIDLPGGYGVKRESLSEFFGYASTRTRLEKELNDSDKETIR